MLTGSLPLRSVLTHASRRNRAKLFIGRRHPFGNPDGRNAVYSFPNPMRYPAIKIFSILLLVLAAGASSNGPAPQSVRAELRSEVTSQPSNSALKLPLVNPRILVKKAQRK